MGELPSPTTEIVCELPLFLSGAAAASTSLVTLSRVKWTPLLHRIGKVEVSKSGYGFRQEPTEILENALKRHTSRLLAACNKYTVSQ
jgi:hypothetical protein